MARRKKKDMSQFRNIMMAEQATPVQPTDIPEHGIVLSDKSWFDTGIVRGENSILRMECDTTELDTRYYSTMYGDNYSINNCLYVRVNNSDAIEAYDCTLHSLDGYNSKGINIVEANLADRLWHINGQEPQPFMGYAAANDNTLSIYLGAFHKADNDVSYSANGLRILRFSHWKDGELIQQLIAHKDEEGTPCLLDTVSGNIIYKSGTGTVQYR